MIITLFKVQKMVIKLSKKKANKFAKELFTTKYKSKIVKPKKGKGSFRREKKIKSQPKFFE